MVFYYTTSSGFGTWEQLPTPELTKKVRNSGESYALGEDYMVIGTSPLAEGV